MKELAKSGDHMVDLATAFDASPNPYVLLTPDLRIAGVNEAYLEVTNSTRDAIVGQPLFAAFDGGPGDEAPENVRQVRASLERARDNRRRDHLALVRFSIPRVDEDGRERFDDRYWSATHTPILSADGEVVFLLQHTTDITELQRLRERNAPSENIDALDAILGGAVLGRAEEVQQANYRLESEHNRLLEMFMQAPGFVAVMSGPEHVFQMHNAAYAQLIGHREITGKPIREALPELMGQGYYEFLDHVFTTGEAHEGRAGAVQLQRTPRAPLETVYLDFIYQPIRDAAGAVVGIFVQGHDVSDTVRSAERQKLMIDELNHRVKNSLATVQSLALQTVQNADGLEEFAVKFEARLMALAKAHDLLTKRNWMSAPLGGLVDDIVAPYSTGPDRLRIDGEPVEINSRAALALTMVLSELATNAAKYGALSRAAGTLSVNWRIASDADPVLIFSWTEEGGPEVQAPTRRGFGTRLIQRCVERDMDGDLDMTFDPAGLRAEVRIPLSVIRLDG